MQRVDPRRAPVVERVHVALLGEPELARHVVRGEAGPPARHLVEPHVVVVDPVRDEHRRLDVADVRQVVAVVPEGVEVAGRVAVV
jgi:hypothetical protein